MGGRRALVTIAGVVGLALAAWWVLLRPAAPDARPAAGPSAARPPVPRGDARAAAPPAPPPPLAAAADAAAGGEAVPPEIEPDELDGDAIAAGWANVDLDEVRRALPDNRYWQMGAPTSDEAELERRARARDHWNVEYGKILSGTGSDQEVRAYYDERARVSGDYVEFASYLLDHYGDVLHPRDVTLLQLARRLHLARLEEIPRNLEQALQRKAQQDEARARWQADERAFNADADGSD